MNSKLIIFCILIAFIPSFFVMRGLYVMSDYHIQQCHWKGFGSKIMGDAFSFDNYVELKDGVIFKDKQPAAEIILIKYRPYADNIMIVSDIDNVDVEMYYEKGCS